MPLVASAGFGSGTPGGGANRGGAEAGGGAVGCGVEPGVGDGGCWRGPGPAVRTPIGDASGGGMPVARACANVAGCGAGCVENGRGGGGAPIAGLGMIVAIYATALGMNRVGVTP